MRPSKAKRELRRKALLIAEQERVLHSALQARHSETHDPVAMVHVRTGLDNAKGKALFGPRHWSPPEAVAIASRSLGQVSEAKDRPHFVADGVRPKAGDTKKRGSLDGFTPKRIDALLSKG